MQIIYYYDTSVLRCTKINTNLLMLLLRKKKMGWHILNPYQVFTWAIYIKNRLPVQGDNSEKEMSQQITLVILQSKILIWRMLSKKRYFSCTSLSISFLRTFRSKSVTPFTTASCRVLQYSFIWRSEKENNYESCLQRLLK